MQNCEKGSHSSFKIAPLANLFCPPAHCPCGPYDPHCPSRPCWSALQGQSQRMERGKWSVKEQKLYVRFLEENVLEIKTKLSRKANKIFKKMSEVVQTRTADQCRSHHQKIINYHGQVEEIIRFYSELFTRGYHSQPPQKAVVPPTCAEPGKPSFYTITRLHNTFRIEIRESAIARYRI